MVRMRLNKKDLLAGVLKAAGAFEFIGRLLVVDEKDFSPQSRSYICQGAFILYAPLCKGPDKVARKSNDRSQRLLRHPGQAVVEQSRTRIVCCGNRAEFVVSIKESYELRVIGARGSELDDGTDFPSGGQVIKSGP